MGKENSNGQMEEDIKVNIKMIKNVVMEYLNGVCFILLFIKLMDQNMWGNGKKENSMVLDL